MSLEEAINNPRVFNQVTLGDVAKDEPPAPTYGKGDVNKNGQIDMEECVMALQHVASLVIQEGDVYKRQLIRLSIFLFISSICLCSLQHSWATGSGI